LAKAATFYLAFTTGIKINEFQLAVSKP